MTSSQATSTAEQDLTRYNPKYRYNIAMITIHWLMAFSLIAMLVSGVIMTRVEFDGQFELYQIHKSMGVLLLIALGSRLLLRCFSDIPPLPTQFPRLEQLAAKMGHIGLYLMMISMVVTGWLMVSSSTLGLPTIVFGLFEWPHLPFITPDESIEALSKQLHFYSAIALGLLLFGHIGAVIKHKQIDKENLLTRMWSPRTGAAIVSVVFTITFSFIVASHLHRTDKTDEQASYKQTIPTPVTNTSETTTDLNPHLYTVDPNNSRISFAGTHAGNPFEGIFETWSADIIFNPDALDKSKIEARFIMASATTGDSLYDGTLTETDWFDVENHPEARFESNRITLGEEGNYRFDGNLTIKTTTQPITFNATISDLTQSPVTVLGSFTINRIDFQLGVSSDPDADWVGKEIQVNLSIVASQNR